MRVSVRERERVYEYVSVCERERERERERQRDNNNIYLGYTVGWAIMMYLLMVMARMLKMDTARSPYRRNGNNCNFTKMNPFYQLVGPSFTHSLTAFFFVFPISFQIKVMEPILYHKKIYLYVKCVPFDGVSVYL